jgi:hypothetical protein
MTVSVLELQRACRALDEFCACRNALVPHSVTRLCCRQEGNRLLIGEKTRVGKAKDTGAFRALVQLSYQDGRWYLFWPLEGGDWRPYPHLPRVDTIQAVIEELEQAPLHVHWG